VSKYDTYLCIGGPRSGQRITCDHDTFAVHHIENMRSLMSYDNCHLPSFVPTAKQIVYLKQPIWRDKDTRIWVWAPMDQTPLETMKLLLTGFERGAHIVNVEKW
jgi:hypothetical protein